MKIFFLILLLLLLLLIIFNFKNNKSNYEGFFNKDNFNIFNIGLNNLNNYTPLICKKTCIDSYTSTSTIHVENEDYSKCFTDINNINKYKIRWSII